MALFKDRTFESANEKARRALEAGDNIYTPRLLAIGGGSGGWAKDIAGIEAAGWRLEHWSVGVHTTHGTSAYPVFRRL